MGGLIAPFVTVLIDTYNYARLIEEIIDSLPQAFTVDQVQILRVDVHDHAAPLCVNSREPSMICNAAAVYALPQLQGNLPNAILEEMAGL